MGENQMNKLLKAVVVATALALPMSASAAVTAPSPFTVTVNLTGSCTVSVAGNFVFNVTAGVAFPGASSNQNVSVTCTNNMAYAVNLDGVAANGGGTAAGIPYTLSLPAGAYAASGTGAAQTYALTAAVAAATYAGDCAAPATSVPGGCTQTNNHTVTVVF
jgi:spore coat protein U-like protein